MKNTELSGTKLKALAGVCLSSLMFGLEISSVPVILPAIKNTLHANFTDLQWIMNAYTIACTAVLMGIGALSDRFGRKLIFLISVVSFGISSFACGVAQNVAVLISFRAVQGMSGGAMLICQVSTLSNLFPDGKERAKAFSYWGIIFGVGLGFGPVIGGGILAVSSWEWVFLIHVLISFITFHLIYLGIGEIRKPTEKSFDYIGMFSLTFSVFFITYFITQSSGEEMRATALIPLLLAVVCLLVFLFAEKKAADPVIDFSVFRVPAFTGAVLGSIGMNISFWPFMIYLPIYFQNALGYDSTFTGLALLAYSLPPLFLPPLAEKLSLRYSAGRVIPFTLLTIGAGFFLMWLGNRSPHAGWLTLLPGLITAGAGL
ncbi:MFS transporter [Mucilaginibacter kameinonensis]|uniref:MFS transporter n=1 Tax=Mucilaginibacter kameinonensis TaxID=452286 RepID=UPI000EF7ACA4|nr:MFS transporter [Mucilaginibacter kameinonensis]